MWIQTAAKDITAVTTMSALLQHLHVLHQHAKVQANVAAGIIAARTITVPPMQLQHLHVPK